jgi:hypothetical protein
LGFFILIFFALKWGIGGIVDQIKGEPLITTLTGNHKEVMSMQGFCVLFMVILLLIAAGGGINRGGGPSAF